MAPERLRFDFTIKTAMTAAEVMKVEDIANTMIVKNQEMYAKEAPLAIAKTRYHEEQYQEHQERH